jgi:hypothetical protein
MMNRILDDAARNKKCFNSGLISLSSALLETARPQSQDTKKGLRISQIHDWPIYRNSGQSYDLCHTMSNAGQAENIMI